MHRTQLSDALAEIGCSDGEDELMDMGGESVLFVTRWQAGSLTPSVTECSFGYIPWSGHNQCATSILAPSS
jgi:hypothetical protein